MQEYHFVVQEMPSKLRPTGVACLARLTDFGAEELVVAHVDLAVYRAGASNE